MPTPTYERYTQTPILHIETYYYIDSRTHDSQGPASGLPGSASYVVDRTGAEGSRLNGLSEVYWWLAVI